MDDKLYNLPLNQAHSFARVAELHERSGKFEEASVCHQKAIEFLRESAKIATFVSTKESIRLQIEYHERQQEVISLKKLQYAVRLKIFEQNQKLMQAIMAEQQKEMTDAKNKDGTLQWAIYKNIEAADSLIDTLAERDFSKLDNESKDEISSGIVYNSGVKHPKSESTVIEELHTLNSKLKELITKLLIQLEESQQEAHRLRAKVVHYESLMQEKKADVKGSNEQNLIDFNSMSSSGESIGIMP